MFKRVKAESAPCVVSELIGIKLVANKKDMVYCYVSPTCGFPVKTLTESHLEDWNDEEIWVDKNWVRKESKYFIIPKNEKLRSYNGKSRAIMDAKNLSGPDNTYIVAEFVYETQRHSCKIGDQFEVLSGKSPFKLGSVVTVREITDGKILAFGVEAVTHALITTEIGTIKEIQSHYQKR